MRRAPLRIGVTGHRVLAEADKIRAGMEEALGRIEAAYRGRSAVVISPLAEGADRLVAAHVLDRHSDARLLAVLPMPADDYVKTFTSPESTLEFECLLSRASCCIALPAAETTGASYQAVGTAVLDRSDVLIAVWDGKRGRGRGGTAGVVRLARTRGLPIVWIHAGNRNAKTGAPTSLGAQQGSVTLENFDVAGRGAPAGKLDPPESDLAPALPYRIRVGVVSDGPISTPDDLSEALALLLPAAILGLFDPQSRKQLDAARYTPIAYSVLARHGVAEDQRLAGAVGQSLAADAAPTVAHSAPIRAGRHVVDHCDVLVVLEAPGRAGAAPDPVLAYAARRQRPILHLQAEPSCRVRVTRGHGLNAKSIARLDLFNRYSPGRPAVEGYVANVFRDLFESAEGRALPSESKEGVRKRLLPYYAKASYLAKRSQGMYRRAGSLVWLLFPLAIAAVALGIHVPSLSTAAFSLEFVLLTTIAVVVTHADRHRSLQWWIETRFLAERIRCASFLAACGCESSSIRVPTYMGGAEQRDQWMVLAFNEIWGGLPPMQSCADAACETIREFVKTAWVGDQIKYHEGKAKSCERMGRRLERWGTVMFLLALAAAIVHLLTARAGHHVTLFSSMLTFAAILLPAVGAALGGFRSHREYSRLGKRSRNMWQELRELQERLSEADDPESIRRALSEAEETMLGETQDWLMLMKFAPVQYPG